mmetsp:Transcript_36637/g.43786  ORF Transcript_36637/g.43786 Transcript_36637/m.43786 type:complete len:194 (-) Transcript_36637:195-776(-)|eukprot:CAMPEP_0198268250 /NCGR_PEP_ID=MMETSP1447-20131203/36402_1 /TAXON_ID=420782 /ORGANISM="Chaetoceros dichaeta, Strain CCMP1751" /LENGTH=193 /DNA_ID=CAMNT_0043959193 /DNA_START=63 /DNA_END=644 /DNA_ORIENTATION=+
MTGDPDWASPGAATAEVIPDAPGSSNLPNGNPVPRKNRSVLWQRLISFVIIGLCASMIALGLSVLFELTFGGFPDFSDFFIAAYMILFAVLLFLYEMMWWCTVDGLNKRIRKNFGFMYKIQGKAAYIIFVALLCLGVDRKILGELEWLQWFTGIAWFSMGILLEVLICFQPSVFRNYQAPSGGYIDETGADAV